MRLFGFEFGKRRTPSPHRRGYEDRLRSDSSEGVAVNPEPGPCVPMPPGTRVNPFGPGPFATVIPPLEADPRLIQRYPM